MLPVWLKRHIATWRRRRLIRRIRNNARRFGNPAPDRLEMSALDRVMIRACQDKKYRAEVIREMRDCMPTGLHRKLAHLITQGTDGEEAAARLSLGRYDFERHKSTVFEIWRVYFDEKEAKEFAGQIANSLRTPEPNARFNPNTENPYTP